ncbi:hypothetical protein L596_001989 [Steinernema carpocapsae]|nr:hypothetical protein L596_001989 [Steinernema carpocapsae]
MPEDETTENVKVGSKSPQTSEEPREFDADANCLSPTTGFKRKRSPSSCSQPDGPSTSNFPPSPRNISTHQMAQETIELLNKMAVVHAVAFDKKVDFSKTEEHPVQKMMEKAHFDIMREELGADPPQYTTFVADILAMKHDLINLVPEGKPRLMQHVEGCVDENHLNKQVENKAIDVEVQMNAIIETAQMMCMPARDDDIRDIQEKTDVTDRMMMLVSLIKNMRHDMSNFHLAMHQRQIKENSMHAEKEYYMKVLTTSPEFSGGVKKWLKLSYGKVLQTDGDTKSPSKKKPATDDSTAVPLTGQQKTQILTGAYLDLLEWNTLDSEFPFPETLAFDKQMICALIEKYQQLIYTTSALVVTQNVAGKEVIDKEGFMLELKNKIIVLLNDIGKTNVNERMEHVAVLCDSEVQNAKKELFGDNYKSQAEADRELFKNQIVALGSATNTVRCLLHKRLRDFFAEVVNNPSVLPRHLLSSFKFVESEVAAVTAKFLKIVDYNRRTFGDFYVTLLVEIHNEADSR